MSEASEPLDPNDLDNLWQAVASHLPGRLDDMWRMVRSVNPGEMAFMRLGPGQGNMSCYFSAKTEDGPGQASVHQYLGARELAIMRRFHETKPQVAFPEKVGELRILDANDGMGAIASVAGIISPTGPDLFRRIAPWYVDSLEAIWNYMVAGMIWECDRLRQVADELRPYAESGDLEAQHKLAVMLLDPDSMIQDVKEGLRWMKLAAEAGHVPSQYSLGVWYSSMDEEYAQWDLAATWWHKAAPSNAKAAYALGVYYSRKADPADPAEALRWYKVAAEAGIPPAQHALAEMYLHGESAEQDSEEGRRLLELAAEAGLTPAMDDLIRLYREADSPYRNAEKAFRWMLRAAEEGSPLSSFYAVELGRAYELGEGIAENFDEARRWYTHATNQREKQGALRLGNMLFRGRGVPRNIAEAIETWQSAERGLSGLRDRFTTIFTPNCCKPHAIEVHNGHILTTTQEDERLIVDTGSPGAPSLADQERLTPGIAEIVRQRFGEGITGILGLKLMQGEAGLVIDLRAGDKGTLWIVEPSEASQPQYIYIDLKVDGRPIRALVDTGAQYSYLRRPLPAGEHTEIVEDFSLFTGSLERFRVALHPLEVRCGENTRKIKFGNLPPRLSDIAFDNIKADAIVGVDLLAGSIFSWDRQTNTCRIE